MNLGQNVENCRPVFKNTFRTQKKLLWSFPILLIMAWQGNKHKQGTIKLQQKRIIREKSILIKNIYFLMKAISGDEQFT